VPVIKIAAAQCPSVAGNIEQNIQLHLQFVDAAIQQQVELLVFPELSLSGYELAFAERCRIHPSDPRLTPFRQRAIQHQMTIAVGAPVDSGDGLPELGAIIFSPYGVTTYAKQHLHGPENQFFKAGAASRPIKVKELPVAMAICADTNHTSHARAAVEAGAHIYAAGVMFSEAGYPADAAQLETYAQSSNMAVLMANHCAPTGGSVPAGASTIWSPGGAVLGRADSNTPALVIAQERASQWQGTVVPIKLTPATSH